jgi:hypothetical protein
MLPFFEFVKWLDRHPGAKAIFSYGFLVIIWAILIKASPTPLYIVVFVVGMGFFRAAGVAG